MFIMPEITRFYGIIIKMFFKPKEHEPAHIHALYNEYVGIFDIHTYEMTEGDMPVRAQQLVKEWLAAHVADTENSQTSSIVILKKYDTAHKIIRSPRGFPVAGDF